MSLATLEERTGGAIRRKNSGAMEEQVPELAGTRHEGGCVVHLHYQGGEPEAFFWRLPQRTPDPKRARALKTDEYDLLLLADKIPEQVRASVLDRLMRLAPLPTVTMPR
jgi:hypothetical protein